MTSTVRATSAQGATFVELFFDLVFVFAVTQVAGVLREHLTVTGLVQAVLVFWLVVVGLDAVHVDAERRGHPASTRRAAHHDRRRRGVPHGRHRS
jgi:hypothetical protein